MPKTFKADNFKSTNQYIFGRTGISFATGIGIDFSIPIVQTITITGSSLKITGALNTSSNSGELKSATIRLKNEYSGGYAGLDFNSNFHFLGDLPTGLKSGSIGVVSFNSFGPAQSDTIAVFRSEGREEFFGIDEGSVLFIDNGVVSGSNRFTWDPTGLLKVSGSIVPTVSGAFDLGTNELRWKDIYLEGTTIHLGGQEISYSGGNFKFGSDFVVLNSSSSSVAGPSGAQGPAGAAGAAGAQGASGVSITGAIGTGVGVNGGASGVIFRFSNGTNSDAVSLPVGPSGAQGPAGGGGGGGSPSGTDGQIQYNNGGLFGGASNFSYNDANGRVVISNLPINIGATGILAISGNGEVTKTLPALIQTVWGELTNIFSTDFDIPFDDTIPQDNEGQEVMSVSITPKYANSYLYVEGAGFITVNSALHGSAVTLIRSGVADAIAATEIDIVNAGFIQPFVVKARVLATGTSVQNFSMRAGHSNVSGAATLDIGGGSSARRFGGVGLTTLTIEERTV